MSIFLEVTVNGHVHTQELLKGDAESQASKILASQHFKKANHEQREEAVKHILGKVR